MASTGSGSTGSKAGGSKGGAADLADEDRKYLSETKGDAKKSGGASGSESEGGLFEALERFGLSSERVQRLRVVIDDMDVKESVEKAQKYLAEQIESARDFAKDNPKKVIGGAAGVLVGASLLAIALRRASGEDKKKSTPAPAAPEKAAASSKKSSKKPATSSKKRSTKSSKK